MKNIRGHSYQIPEIHHGGAIPLTNPFQKAETFCRFFVSKLVKEDTSSLKNIKQDLDKTTSEMKTSDIVILEDEVYKLLSKIDTCTSKASGPDELPGRLLKEGAQWIASPLSKLFSLSLAHGKLPQDWTSI